MNISRLLGHLAKCRSGSAVVEFALGGGIFVAVLIGVFQAAIQVQNYNALRTVSADVSRTVLVEYEKGNELTPEQIKARAAGAAVGAPYLLQSERLDVEVTQPTSRVTGAREFGLTLNYMLPNWLQLLGISDGEMSYTRSIFVPG